MQLGLVRVWGSTTDTNTHHKRCGFPSSPDSFWIWPERRKQWSGSGLSAFVSYLPIWFFYCIWCWNTCLLLPGLWTLIAESPGPPCLRMLNRGIKVGILNGFWRLSLSHIVWTLEWTLLCGHPLLTGGWFGLRFQSGSITLFSIFLSALAYGLTSHHHPDTYYPGFWLENSFHIDSSMIMIFNLCRKPWALQCSSVSQHEASPFPQSQPVTVSLKETTQEDKMSPTSCPPRALSHAGGLHAYKRCTWPVVYCVWCIITLE